MRDLPFDLAVRTGTFVRGTRTIHARVELGGAFAPDSGNLALFVYAPSGKMAGYVNTAVRTAHGQGYWWFPVRVRLSAVGRWRLWVSFHEKALADTSFEVVATKAQVRNRAPRPVSVELSPEAPSPGQVVQCLVLTSLVKEDPDYDIVRYRYRWTVGGKLVRAVQSAALSDVLRKGAAKAGQPLRCAVTPYDGRLFGRTAAVTATSR